MVYKTQNEITNWFRPKPHHTLIIILGKLITLSLCTSLAKVTNFTTVQWREGYVVTELTRQCFCTAVMTLRWYGEGDSADNSLTISHRTQLLLELILTSSGIAVLYIWLSVTLLSSVSVSWYQQIVCAFGILLFNISGFHVVSFRRFWLCDESWLCCRSSTLYLSFCSIRIWCK